MPGVSHGPFCFPPGYFSASTPVLHSSLTVTMVTPFYRAEHFSWDTTESRIADYSFGNLLPVIFIFLKPRQSRVRLAPCPLSSIHSSNKRLLNISHESDTLLDAENIQNGPSLSFHEANILVGLTINK